MALAQEIIGESTASARIEVAYDVPTREAEAQLVYSLGQGENSGFETLVRSYGPLVMAVARRYLRSEADAADCFQETFIAVFESIGQYEQRSSLRHWVRGIAINKCLMCLRKRETQREQSIEHLLPLYDERGHRLEVTSPAHRSGIEELLDKEHLHRVVRETIDELPDRYRLVLLLRDIDGYSTRETASILGIKENTAKTRLHRSRMALKSLLKPVLGKLEAHVDV